MLAAALCGGCSSTDGDPADGGFGEGLVTGDLAGPSEDAPGCTAGPARSFSDLAYATIAGVKKPKRITLDVHVPARKGKCTPAPVVVWIHGGGWASGDKQNEMEDKISLFNGQGYLLVSINYRLSPRPASTDPQRIKHPVHVQDVARALDWISDNIAKGYGGDAGKITLLGHSAGAHLATLVATDESLLAAHGHKLSLLDCVGSLDTQAYDIPAVLKSPSGATKSTYENAFGTDPATWKKASPITHVAAGKKIPPLLLARRGTASRRAILASFEARLKAAGITSTTIDASSLTHAEVKEYIGKSGDTVMTKPLLAFLKGCFGG